MSLKLTSSAFREGQPIPQKYTGDGKDLSPPLAWTNPPSGTVSLVLICDDPDAPRGTWVHWVLYNLPSDLRNLDEGVPKDAALANGAVQGKTDFGSVGYGGPAPPPGKPHRYFFKLYAVDMMVTLPAGATKGQVTNAINGHVLGEAQLMGTYQR